MMKSTRLLMLDSGAFSAWSKDAEIDLEAYITFCKEHPDVSYYVNLDVIPGKPFQPQSITPESVEASAKAGWKNYLRMLEELPKEKVVPVFHQGEQQRWLEKYLNFGTPYIGISPANDRRTTGTHHHATFEGREDPTTTKLQWMRSLKPLLFDKAGRPTIKTHGFAVTSYDLMKLWEWHSVDSASWRLVAAWGGMYLPAMSGDEFDYSVKPQIISISPVSTDPSRLEGRHLKTQIQKFLDELNVPLGSFEIKDVSADYKLNRKEKEVWFKKQKQVLVPLERGVTTTAEDRARVNAEFIKRANKALPVKHIYFAGSTGECELEYELGRRLMSYHEIKGAGAIAKLARHLKLIRAYKKKRLAREA